jgi:UDP-N-acetylglucosamine diphosphorylase/glucosamine-1-phosphate N-acetyltransferase
VSDARVFLYDDAAARRFEPFALTRPIATLVAGAMPVGARWEAIGGQTAGYLTAEHLAEFDEGPTGAPDSLPEGSIVANSRFAPSLTSARIDSSADAWMANGRPVAVRLKQPVKRKTFADGAVTLDGLRSKAGKSVEITGWWHEEVWDFLKFLPETLAADLGAMGAAKKTPNIRSFLEGRPPRVEVLGDHPVLLERGATVEPFVVFDASAGPIYVDEGVIIHSFTRINGPCYVGRNSTIMGGDVSGCSIGPVSKIRGEISGTIVLGYSNKGHDGFVGNSCLGKWVNLGAGTVTSNLKNTYGEVSLWTPTGIRPTGMQFLGTLFGDHVKTGIGTRLTTGTVLGAGANVFGPKMPPKAVAPFSWGEEAPYDLYKIEKFLDTAKTVMARRKVDLTERMKQQLAKSFEKRWSVK